MERSPLTLYRRHKKTCKIAKAKLSHAAKRLYMKCDCPIWMNGYAGDFFVDRQSTGTNDIDIAEAQRQAVQLKARSVDAPTSAEVGLRISECGDKFIAERTAKIGERPTAQYKFLLDRFKAFCDSRNIAFAKDLTVDVIEDFKVSHHLPGKEATTRANAFAKLR